MFFGGDSCLERLLDITFLLVRWKRLVSKHSPYDVRILVCAGMDYDLIIKIPCWCDLLLKDDQDHLLVIGVPVDSGLLISLPVVTVY